MTSTSFMIGTGLKKCRPPKRSGRFVAAASSVMQSDEVFDRRIVCVLHDLLDRRIGRALLVEVLDDRLDDEVAVLQRVERSSSPDRLPSVVSRASAVTFPFATPSSRNFLMRPSPLSRSASFTSRTIVL